MTNTETGAIGFRALDRDWLLRFSTNALCEIEAASGQSAIALANSMADSQNIRISDIRLMFWAGLLYHHSIIDLPTAGGIIDDLGIAAAGDLLGKALIAAFPDMGAGESDKGKPKRR